MRGIYRIWIESYTHTYTYIDRRVYEFILMKYVFYAVGSGLGSERTREHVQFKEWKMFSAAYGRAANVYKYNFSRFEIYRLG